jgi:uncharacterized protein YjbI with pentapeptide repeats
MAVCAYLLVIVFGTTHLDLLFGKGIKLPFVDVEVPIAGFYTVAPYLLVLVHFNFLLQLQLLSRKLYAFNFRAPNDEWTGSLRDQLYGFPFTIYLVGRANPIVRAFLGLMVSITIILLPLITLVAMQLMFLAYQEESITWAQRAAIWIDVGVIVALWPLIMDPEDDWRAFWSRIFAAYSPKWRLWLALPILFAGLSLVFFGTSLRIFLIGIGLAIFSPLPAVIGFKRGHRREILLTLVLLVFALWFMSLLRTSELQPILWQVYTQHTAANSLVLAAVFLAVLLALFWKIFIQRGSLVFVMAICIFPLLSLSIMVDGERMEQQVTRIQDNQQTQLCNLRKGFRSIFLPGETLIAKQSAKPEVLGLIRRGSWREALTQIEPLKLGKNRKLRHAFLLGTILTGAQLGDVDLQGANLGLAQLQGANLSSAHLQGASLGVAQLQGANLDDAQLQGANLGRAQLQGATLGSATLQGANLRHAQLQGADLGRAHILGANLIGAMLQGAHLDSAQLQGANLGRAQLQGANLNYAELHGADLREANLYGAEGRPKGNLVDVRAIRMKPMSPEEVEQLAGDMESNLPSSMPDERKNEIMVRIRNLGRLPASTIHLDSCLSDVKDSIPDLECGQRFNASEEKEMTAFITKLHPMLAHLACNSTEIANGLMQQAIQPTFWTDDILASTSTRHGLATQFAELISDKSCAGLWGLSPEKKEEIQDAAKQGPYGVGPKQVPKLTAKRFK